MMFAYNWFEPPILVIDGTKAVLQHFLETHFKKYKKLKPQKQVF